MKLSHKIRCCALGVALVGIATLSSAMTLGPARGVFLLGQPLDMTVQVEIAEGQDANSTCFDAGVFYADKRQNPDSVTIETEAMLQPSVVSVRIVANAKVDEPVVTVYLRAGCGYKASRRYVLLTELASERNKATAAGFDWIGARPTESEEASAAVNSIEPIGSSVSLHGVTGQNENGHFARTLVQVRPSPTRGKLQLFTIEADGARDSLLKWSGELITPISDDLQLRADAATAWRTLTLTAQEVFSGGATVIAMHEEIASLHSTSMSGEVAVRELSARLERANTHRFTNLLVVGLALTLAFCGLAFSLVVKKFYLLSGRATPWWVGQFEGRDHTPGGVSAVCKNQVETGFLGSGKAHNIAESVDVPSADSCSLGPDFRPRAQVVDTGAEPTAVSQPTPLVSEPFVRSSAGTLRDLSSQEMLDVRQQADFFMALGQYDDAIRVLRACISQSEPLNPLVYLDLLKIFQKLSQRSEYDLYGQQFKELFSVLVPVFADFHVRGKYLEDYTEVCERITAFWPSNEALRYIEQCLVRVPGAIFQLCFDLEAFDDLLTLHAVGKRLMSDTESGLLPFVAMLSAPIGATSAVSNSTAQSVVDLDLS